ncbi:MAG: tryptophan synthase subunit alpha [Fimbriimonadaceae bacterium]|nr:tryptophan synthase subunit alpha [Fimbriimonadaceae bacterium]
MARLADWANQARDEGAKALVAFVTAGDPSLEELPAIMETLADAGADVIELGIPFSDPIADGPTIQAASNRSLGAGTRLTDVLRAVRGFDRVPILMMGYLNPMLAYGLERLAQDAASAAISGSIVCDLLPDEAGEWRRLSLEAGLDTVFIAAPTCTDERLRTVAEASLGFVYALSRTGVTGSGMEISSDAQGLVARLRRETPKPVYVGFGVSNPSHVREVVSFADGAIVGSPIVDLVCREWKNGQGRETLARYVREMKQATLA